MEEVDETSAGIKGRSSVSLTTASSAMAGGGGFAEIFSTQKRGGELELVSPTQ